MDLIRELTSIFIGERTRNARGTHGWAGEKVEYHKIIAILSTSCLGLTSCERCGGNTQWSRDGDCKKAQLSLGLFCCE